MQLFLTELSIGITIIAIIPYLTEITRGNVKPRLATWFIWSLLAFIGASASFSNHQFPAGAFALATGFEAEWVVLLGFKRGDRSFDQLDFVSIIGVIACLGLLLLLKNPSLTILAATMLVFIGTLPTFRHSWINPAEETWITYALCVPAEILILFAGNFHDVTAYVFPLYYLVEDVLLTGFSLLSPHRRTNELSTSPARTSTGFNLNMHRPVPPPPPISFTSPDSLFAMAGTRIDFQITVKSLTPVTIRLNTTPPPGLQFIQANGVGWLTGTVPAGSSGYFPLTITAVNEKGAVTQILILEVAPPAPVSDNQSELQA